MSSTRVSSKLNRKGQLHLPSPAMPTRLQSRARPIASPISLLDADAGARAASFADSYSDSKEAPRDTSTPPWYQPRPRQRPEDVEQPRAVSPTVTECAPWKEEGYPAYTKWTASSNDFFIFRRFGALNARAILLMQDRITRFENELHALDDAVANSSDDRRNDSFRLDAGSNREAILDKLIPLLHQYNEYVSTFSALKARPSAPEHQLRNVRNWHQNHPTAIHAQELKWLEASGDIIGITSKQKPPLRRMLENLRLLRLSRLFQAKTRWAHVPSPSTKYSSDTGFELFVTLSTILVGICFLLGPMWWLNNVGNSTDGHSNNIQMGIISGFIGLFTTLLTLSTVGKPFEVLAATAAYAAVLMVFMQINPSNGQSNPSNPG